MNDLKRKHALWQKQYELSESIISEMNLTIVTCPSCGHISIQSCDLDVFTCPHCFEEDESFPELFHERHLEDFIDNQ